MRLIDADNIKYNPNILAEMEINPCIGMKLLLSIQPTIQAVPLKQGHWKSRESDGEVLPFYMRYECSECGETADKSNYCPNCGAKMVEPQESEDK